MTPSLTVIVPTHNPHPGRLARTLAGLKAQTLVATDWELLIVDNASVPGLTLESLPADRPAHTRLVRENTLGLTAARRCGFAAAQGEFWVLVDDDNILAPTYLAEVLRLFAAYPRLGAAGGPSRPEFEVSPPLWAGEFLSLLALRDLGSQPIVSTLTRAPDGVHWLYPDAAPIGAGMAIRRAAAAAWLDSVSACNLSDRRGTALTSGGDNDIVLTILHAGWQVGYFPALALTHLIPASRLTPGYLARLNRGIQTSWMQVLAQHEANPWPPLSPWGVRLRQWRAYFAYRGWHRPAGYIRWQGVCGHFAGRRRR